MKTLLFALLVLHCSLPASARSDSLDVAAIAGRWQAAYNGTDARALEPLYAVDAQYISGHVAGLVADGRRALIENFQRGMDLGGHIDSLTVLSVTRSCDLATVLLSYHATNSGEKASGRTLLVLVRSGERWLIRLHMTVV